MSSCSFSFVPLVKSLAVPAYGLGSLSDDEGGVSGVVHTLPGKRDRMVHTGFFQSDSCGGKLTVWCAHRQALVQIKLESAQRDLNLFCLFNILVPVKAAFINRHELDSLNRNPSLGFLNTFFFRRCHAFTSHSGNGTR